MASQKKIEWSEVGKHNRHDDFWFVVKDGVYNPTTFLETHPGGPALLLARAGQDATRDFVEQNHSQGAYAKLEKFRIGSIAEGSQPAEWQSGKRSLTFATNFSFLVIILTFVYSIIVLSKGPYNQQQAAL